MVWVTEATAGSGFRYFPWVRPGRIWKEEEESLALERDTPGRLRADSSKNACGTSTLGQILLLPKSAMKRDKMRAY